MRRLPPSEAALWWLVVATSVGLFAATVVPVLLYLGAIANPAVSGLFAVAEGAATLGASPVGTFLLLGTALVCYTSSISVGSPPDLIRSRRTRGGGVRLVVLAVLLRLAVAPFIGFGGAYAFLVFIPLGVLGIWLTLSAVVLAARGLVRWRRTWDTVRDGVGCGPGSFGKRHVGFGAGFWLESAVACLWLVAAAHAVADRLGAAVPSPRVYGWGGDAGTCAWNSAITFLLPRGASAVLASGAILMLRALRVPRTSGVGPVGARLRFSLMMGVGVAAILAFCDVFYQVNVSYTPAWMAWRLWLLWEFYTIGAVAFPVSSVVVLRDTTAAARWIGRGLPAQMHAEGSRRLASVHFWSACTLGIYGGWVAHGGASRPTDEALRKQGTCCWQWAVMCVLLVLCFFGVVGGFCVAICLLAAALVPPSGIGVALGAYETIVAIAYLWIFIGYSVRAYRRVLAGGEPAYPMARGFRLF